MPEPQHLTGLSAIAPRLRRADLRRLGRGPQRPCALRNGRRCAADIPRASAGRWCCLSNAPRPAADVRAQFDRSACRATLRRDRDLGRRHARRARAPRRRTARCRFFIIGPPRDAARSKGLNVAPCRCGTTPSSCSPPASTTTKARGPTITAPLLEPLAARGLTMLCANPDVVVQRGDEADLLRRRPGASLMKRWAAPSIYYGKPHPPVFHAALRAGARAGCGARVSLVVGDNLDTDIRGRQRAWDSTPCSLPAACTAPSDRRQPRKRRTRSLPHAGVMSRGWMAMLAW